jgi:peptidoglycan/xylan/chitin deacetylase (PgdA/CDA1 family)
MKKAMKIAVGKSLASTGVMRYLTRHMAPVVAFHRVNDRNPGNGLTCNVQRFKNFCAFFSDHFHVVPLRTLALRLQNKEPVDHMLAITFDDGYEDNYEEAVPILKSAGLPATFFITTGFIETGIIPWWDRTAGVTERWMSWKQVTTLHSEGFDIGAHTRTHIDLGEITGQQAWDEIEGSKRDLEEKLNAAVSAFAYPYGRPNQVTDGNRDLVKKAGFNSCCSCFGGVNTGVTDPWSILRIPIGSWHVSPFEFGFELICGKTKVTY